ncbi:MAG: hypothetical protein E3J45_04340, partial [Candidatus Zixiibacteriota bacterium]
MKTVNKLSGLAATAYLVLFVLGGISLAQSEGDYSFYQQPRASQYYMERVTERKLMMKVNVWGAV